MADARIRIKRVGHSSGSRFSYSPCGGRSNVGSSMLPAVLSMNFSQSSCDIAGRAGAIVTTTSRPTSPRPTGTTTFPLASTFACFVIVVINAPRQLYLKHQPRRIFQQFLHPHEKSHALTSIHKPMIVAERHVHHRADFNFIIDNHGAL